MKSFDSLPDEIALKIVKMAAQPPTGYLGGIPMGRRVGVDPKYDHDFLVDILCKVSPQFKRLATDPSLWKGSVKIWMDDGRAMRKDRFVVQECLNSGTREFTMLECGMQGANMANPTTRFPKLKHVYTYECRSYGMHDRYYHPCCRWILLSFSCCVLKCAPTRVVGTVHEQT